MTGLKRQLTLLLATVVTLVMNYLSSALPLFGRSNKDVSDALPNAFTPAGLTFAIWGPIFLGLLLFALYQALPAQRTARYDRLFWPYLLANVLNVLWLLAFQSLHLALSVVIMLTLLLSLIWLYLTVRHLKPERTEAWVLQVPASMYLAWISVATMANITAFLVSTGFTADLLGLSAPAWSVILIATAAAVGVFFLARFHDAAFAAVLLWALYGVYAARPDVAVIAEGAGVAAAMLVVAGIQSGRKINLI